MDRFAALEKAAMEFYGHWVLQSPDAERRTNIETVFDSVRTRADAYHFVMDCEAALENALHHAAQTVLTDGCEILTISGPTCSGKTTTSDRLMQKIKEAGHRAVLFSFDDFF